MLLNRDEIREVEVPSHISVTTRLLAGWVKMPGERDCCARFEKDWIYN
jgi:hypothetical protein